MNDSPTYSFVHDDQVTHSYVFLTDYDLVICYKNQYIYCFAGEEGHTIDELLNAYGARLIAEDAVGTADLDVLATRKALLAMAPTLGREIDKLLLEIQHGEGLQESPERDLIEEKVGNIFNLFCYAGHVAVITQMLEYVIEDRCVVAPSWEAPYAKDKYLN